MTPEAERLSLLKSRENRTKGKSKLDLGVDWILLRWEERSSFYKWTGEAGRRMILGSPEYTILAMKHIIDFEASRNI